MKILITGGGGFIGSHVVERALQQGHEVVVLDDFSTATPSNLKSAEKHQSLNIVQGSVLDQTLVENLVSEVDGCFHLAAALGVERIMERPLQSLAVNLQGSENVLNACARSKVRTVLSSSSEIYGKTTDFPISEESDRVIGSPLKWRWMYSEAKALDESIASVLHHQQGFKVSIVRFFNTVGPRQTGAYGMVVPRFVKAALNNQPLVINGTGEQSRVFCHVDDAVDGLWRVFESEAFGEVFNVGGVEEVSINELANRVITLTHSQSVTAHRSYEEAYGEGFEDMQRRVPDTSKLSRVTGWRAKYGLDAIIDDVAAYLRTTISL